MNTPPKNSNLTKAILYHSGQKALGPKLLNPEVKEGDVQWAGAVRIGKQVLAATGIILTTSSLVGAFAYGEGKTAPYRGDSQVDQGNMPNPIDSNHGAAPASQLPTPSVITTPSTESVVVSTHP
jgi:hypothetical protein